MSLAGAGNLARFSLMNNLGHGNNNSRREGAEAPGGKMNRRNFLQTLGATAAGVLAPAALADFGLEIIKPGTVEFGRYESVRFIKVLDGLYIGPGMTVRLEDGEYLATKDIVIEGGRLIVEKTATFNFAEGCHFRLSKMGSVIQTHNVPDRPGVYQLGWEWHAG